MNVTGSTPEAKSDERDDVLEILTEQCSLCRQLKGLADRQRMLIASDQAEMLLEVLGRRRQIIDRLAALANRMRPYQQCWTEVRSRMADDDARRADEMISELNAALAGILQGDKADAEILAGRRRETASDLGRLKATRMAGAAYAASQEGPQVSQVEWTDQ